LTVLIRVYNPAFPEGVGLAVLFMNLFAPLLDHIEIKLRLRKRIPNV
jgi:Na+-transporting NADH:ubiquinone oxidoreductase subunit B